MQTVEKIAGKETSNLRQSAGMLDDEKQPENNVSGRVSESRKCFQLGTQFRDTSRELSTTVHDTQGTHIEHHHRDSTCTTVITDDELTNDVGDKMEEGEQGGDIVGRVVQKTCLSYFVLAVIQMFSRRCLVFCQKQREIDQGQSVHRRFFQVSAKQKQSVSRLALARHRETARINFLAAAEGAPLGKHTLWC